jgi:hypothetical protein
MRGREEKVRVGDGVSVCVVSVSVVVWCGVVVLWCGGVVVWCGVVLSVSESGYVFRVCGCGVVSCSVFCVVQTCCDKSSHCGVSSSTCIITD